MFNMMRASFGGWLGGRKCFLFRHLTDEPDRPPDIDGTHSKLWATHALGGTLKLVWGCLGHLYASRVS